MTLNLDGNGNEYVLNVYGYDNDPKKVNLLFTMNKKATNFQKKDEPTCYAVNGNDYLGSIYIYNAK